MSAMFFKPVPRVWRYGQVPNLDLFVSFGEVAELEAERWQTSSDDDFMTMFVRHILRGEFDPTLSPEPMTFVEQLAFDASLHFMLVPLFLPPIKADRGQAAVPPRFVGFGNVTSDDIPMYVANAHHHLGDGPLRRTAQDFADYADCLLATKFEDLPEIVQSAFIDIIIAKENLKLWYDRRNMYVPSDETPDDLSCNTEQACAPEANRKPVQALRGRPEKPAWSFIRRRARELKQGDPKLLHKEIAGRVMQEAAMAFKPSDLPNASTVIKEMGRILDGV